MKATKLTEEDRENLKSMKCIDADLAKPIDFEAIRRHLDGKVVNTEDCLKINEIFRKAGVPEMRIEPIWNVPIMDNPYDSFRSFKISYNFPLIPFKINITS